ncbi:MAG TPA: carotenoid biosynthesis protein, partial [Kineosporiaceae bacterium]|nr:carotenoid biosynthesis protein [Kineosporiaceae bacterium]
AGLRTAPSPVHQGAAPDVPVRARHPRLGVVAAVAAAVAVLAQISYPLLTGVALRTATIAAVLAFATASVASAAAWLGIRAGALLLLVAGGLGLAAEAIGVSTGVPFGTYRYAGTLGPQLLGVPLLVPLAWTMMAYPALLAARRLASSARGRAVVVALIGGVTLAAWDLYLDPQMVAAGHWSWAYPAPSLPGIADVPLTNTAGWLLVGTLMTAALHVLLPAPPTAGEVLPAALLTWTWLGSLLANLAFFGRPQVAVLGGVAMALVVVPYLLRLRTAGRRS